MPPSLSVSPSSVRNNISNNDNSNTLKPLIYEQIKKSAFISRFDSATTAADIQY